jgi:hypothetical protein
MLKRSVRELTRVRTSLVDTMFAKRQASLGSQRTRGLMGRDARLEACESGAVTPNANDHDVVAANEGIG